MPNWSSKTEEELSLLIKDWLKNQNRSQADLSRNLDAHSTRMSAIIEVLKKTYEAGGIAKLAQKLCLVEARWSLNKPAISESQQSDDPFGQLDLLLEELREKSQISDNRSQESDSNK